MSAPPFPRENDPPPAGGVTAAAERCPVCRSSSVSTTAKNPDENSYWRCDACGEVWNVGRRLAGRLGASPWR
jgi:transposase-like protein